MIITFLPDITNPHAISCKPGVAKEIACLGIRTIGKITPRILPEAIIAVRAILIDANLIKSDDIVFDCRRVLIECVFFTACYGVVADSSAVALFLFA